MAETKDGGWELDDTNEFIPLTEEEIKVKN